MFQIFIKTKTLAIFSKYIENELSNMNMAPDNCDEMEIVTNLFFLIMTYIQCYSQLTTG